MKLVGGAIACLLALAVIQGCTGKDDTTTGEHKDAGGGKSQEETLIEKTLIDLANAYTQFPHTKDVQSILRFYTQDYEGINHGKAESVKDIGQSLADVLERINLGAPIGILVKVTNIQPSVTRSSGWATFEYDYKLGSGGAVLETEQGKCTTIFKKQGDAWLIRHNHCSTMQGLTNLAQTQQPPGCPIIGNTRSSIYHQPGGQYYAQMQFSPNAVCFKSEADAQSHGYRPSQR